jgi:phosphate transport system protein
LARKQFDHLIGDIREDLLHLGDAVAEALTRAMHSLQTRNTTTALWVIQNDNKIDEARRNLEERVIGMLATQQPVVAYDLRFLTVVTAVASELERIGDYATSISRRVYRAPDYSMKVALPENIGTMIERVQHMIKVCLQAFIEEDAEEARKLGELDEEVDKLEDQLHDELVALTQVDSRYVEPVIDLLDVVHALERAADRTTNIGERIIYLVTSEREEINP